MKVQGEMEKNKLNNSGFSLLEVLVAVIILGIISIPLIRSFGTAAVTNYKANILMMSTDWAENIMEIIEFESVDDLVTRYSGAGNSVTENSGIYNFKIASASDRPGNLPEGYYLEVKLDPSNYPNNNAVNIADVKSMSIMNSAVYEMSKLYDASIYSTFHNWNEEAADTGNLGFIMAPNGYFEENLTRTIDVKIDNQGTGLNDAGETVELITVNLDIKYDFANANLYWRYLPAEQREYIEETQELFNNLSTKEKLTGIYIFYQPRFLATTKTYADKINIYNPDNVETDVFIVAQSSSVDQPTLDYYFSPVTGPLVTIEETWADNDPDDAFITLYTNLSEGAPYSELDGTDGSILCRLSYEDARNIGSSKTGNDAVNILDGRDLDGKVLIGSNTKDRIYTITATVKDAAGNKIVELDGTKLE